MKQAKGKKLVINAGTSEYVVSVAGRGEAAVGLIQPLKWTRNVHCARCLWRLLGSARCQQLALNKTSLWIK